jgi:hypothetical protein
MMENQKQRHCRWRSSSCAAQVFFCKSMSFSATHQDDALPVKARFNIINAITQAQFENNAVVVDFQDLLVNDGRLLPAIKARSTAICTH